MKNSYSPQKKISNDLAPRFCAWRNEKAPKRGRLYLLYLKAQLFFFLCVEFTKNDEGGGRAPSRYN